MDVVMGCVFVGLRFGCGGQLALSEVPDGFLNDVVPWYALPDEPNQKKRKTMSLPFL